MMRRVRDGYRRPFDLAILVSAHIALLPLWVALWTAIPLAIWLEDRGPIFYRQQRVGKDGKRFVLLKFRTMVPDAERLGPIWTREGDERITRVGRLLRRTALDELPQLLNIWKGDMGFVGPKPLSVPEHELFVRQIPDFERRNQVLPGLTGLAQVYDRADDIQAKLRYDLEYIQRRTPQLDAQLLLLSVLNTLTGRWDRRIGKPKAAPAGDVAEVEVEQTNRKTGQSGR